MSTKHIFLSLERDEFKQILIEVLNEHSNIAETNKEVLNKQPELLTQKEVLKVLGISMPTLLSWRRLGLIEAVKINRSVRYHKDDIDNLLKRLPSIKFSRNLGEVG